jgi:putative ABC transport system permease protein
MQRLIATLTWPEWRLHPWRQGVALLAVALGVALALSVHLINGSALAEFGAATRQLSGQPDLTLRAASGSLDEAWYARVAQQPDVDIASPVVEGQLQARSADGREVGLRLIGLDALVAGPLAPALLPQPDAKGERLSALDPGAVFLNATAREQLGDGPTLQLANGITLQRRGGVAAATEPLAVMDIAGAQALLGQLGRLSRIDLRLRPGADRAALLQALRLPPGVIAASAGDADARMANLSRAYRVNLTVLALVALFTGAFLVFSVLALSVARRMPTFALLGVLGLTPRERLQLVLAEGALLGLAGALLGVALGTGLAAAALRWLGGDLGGGYFHGLQPRLHVDPLGALVYGALGVAASVVGAWVPARQAEALAPAQALKGLGHQAGPRAPAWLGPLLLLVAAGLCALPPVGDLPLAAYLGVACGLVGGIACVPMAVDALLRGVPKPSRVLPLLALARAREQRDQASIAVAGVVAALSLGVALSVMVGSFRSAVDDWLGQLLPADLYLHMAGGEPGDSAPLPPTLLQAAAGLPGVARLQGQRFMPLQLDPRRPAVTLIARELDADPARSLPLVGPLLSGPFAATPVLVSEAMASLYGAQPGRQLDLALPDGRSHRVVVRGVWRDYARQHGALVMSLADYQRISGDHALSALALWLAPQADVPALQQALRRNAGGALEITRSTEIRAASLQLFDRSFAVTRYLQAVAIAIGLFGVAASFSAQVLARRKEFGMLAHLGFTRGQVLALVAGEGALWTGAGALLGLGLGLLVSVVLVKVVNPQSFHWTMDMDVPWLRLAQLCVAVCVAGTATAALAGRAAAGRELALAVKEDW